MILYTYSYNIRCADYDKKDTKWYVLQYVCIYILTLTCDCSEISSYSTTKYMLMNLTVLQLSRIEWTVKSWQTVHVKQSNDNLLLCKQSVVSFRFRFWCLYTYRNHNTWYCLLTTRLCDVMARWAYYISTLRYQLHKVRVRARVYIYFLSYCYKIVVVYL